MACSTDKIKKDTLNHARKLIETKTIKMDKNGVVRFDFKGSDKYSEGAISNIADNVIKRLHEGRNVVNKQGKKEFIPGMNQVFKNKYLTANMLTKGQDVDGVFLQYRFPQRLEQAYKIKNQYYTQEQIDLAYQQREKALQKEYEDYQKSIDIDFYDDLITVDETKVDGFNYANYIGLKQELRNMLSKKVNVLRNKLVKGKSLKKDYDQIAEIESVILSLNKDLKNLKSTDSTLKNYFNYFNNDLKVVSNLLNKGSLENLDEILENQSIDNISIIESYIRTLKLVTSTGENGFLNKDLEDMVSEEAIYEAFSNFQKELSKLENIHVSQKKKLIKSVINEYVEFEYKDLNKEEREKKVQDLYEEKILKNLEEMTFLESYLHTMDSSEKSLPNQIMMVIFNKAHSKKEHRKLQEGMINIKDAVIKRLQDLGHTNNRSWIGSLYNPVSYNKVFFRRYKDGSNRLAQKFSANWFNFKNQKYNDFQRIEDIRYKKNKTEEEWKSVNRKEDKLFKDINKDAHFIDVNMIPEIRQDEDFIAEVETDITAAEAQAYKQKIIADIGEIEYYKLVADQKSKLYTYLANINQDRRILEAEYGKDLPTNKQNELWEAETKNSPFVFGTTYRKGESNKIPKKHKDADGTISTYYSNANVEHLTYYPRKNSKFYDKEYEQIIENDDVLRDAWKLMDKALIYINQNGHSQFNSNVVFDNSLIYHRNSFQAHLSTGAKTIIPLLRKRTMDWVKKVLSTTPYQDPSDIDKIQIKGGVQTVDEVVGKQHKIHLSALKAMDVGYMEKRFSYLELPKVLKDYLQKLTVPNSELSFRNTSERLTVSSMLKQILSEKVMNEQEIDIFDSLMNQMDIVSNFKAKREIETKLKFIFSETDRLKKENKRIGRFDLSPGGNALGRLFLERKLYGINNSANLTGKEEMNKVYNSHEKEIRETIDFTLDILKKQENLTVEMQKEIDALEAYKESQGRVITSGSIFEAFVLKLPRFKAFAANLKAQTTNYMMGDFNARQVDGLSWTAGNYDRAKSFTRKWKKHLKRQAKKDYQLTDLILNRLQLFQNSANEIYKVKQSIVHKSTLQKILADPGTTLNPTQVVGLVEKSIQRPQILAKMGDLKIKDIDGKEYPVFDVTDLNDPWKAFDINEKGNLILKEQFKTDDNIATWLNNNSLEYAQLFGESGELPKMIAYVNGDYRDSSIYRLEQYGLTRMAFMFKRWFPATVLKNLGIYKDLAKAGQGGKAFAITSYNGLIRALEAGTYLGTPALVAAIGIYTIGAGVTLSRRGISENLKQLRAMAQAITFASVAKGFGTGGRIFAAGILKTTQQVVNSVTGNHTLSNELINSVAGFNKIEDDENTDSPAKLQFLLTGFARTLNFVMLRLAIHALLFPDDDEEENYDKDESFYTRLFKDFDTTTFYLLENLSSGLLEDTNMFLSPDNLKRTFTDMRTMEQLWGFIEAGEKQWREGDLKSGPNMGKNRLWVQLGKTYKPSMLDDMSLPPTVSFGFNSNAKYDFDKKDPISKAFMSDLEKTKANREAARLKEKVSLEKEYQNKIEDKKKREKKVDQLLRRKFPPIKKKYFDEKGNLKEVYKNNKNVKEYL